MPLPSASEIAAFRAFPLPPAKVLFTKRRIIKCLKIVALFDLYGDKILCGNPDTWAAVKQRLKANREPYAHMSADIYHKALEAIKEADGVEKSYEWNQPYLNLMSWWYYDYVYEKRMEAWDILYVFELSNPAIRPNGTLWYITPSMGLFAR